MTEEDRTISVIVDSGATLRGLGAEREDIPLGQLAQEVERFVGDLREVFESAAKLGRAGSAALAEVEISASLEAGGKLSLFGSGIESKGQAGIKFKFVIPKADGP